MKKINSFMLAILAVCLVAPVFTSCDDKDETIVQNTINNIVSEYSFNDSIVAKQKATSKKDVAVLLVAFGLTVLSFLKLKKQTPVNIING